MKKMAFLGAVSAIALLCTPVLADPPHQNGGSDPLIETDDIQVPVATGGSAAAAVDESLNGNLNGNDVGSYNNTTTTTTATDNSSDDDVDVNATDNNVLSGNTTTIQDNSTNTETENKLEIEDNNLFSNNKSYTKTTTTTVTTAIDNSVTVDDVMVNSTFQAMNVGGVGAQVSPFDDISKGGSGFAGTGSIGGVNVESTKGITAANFNTGIGAQANSISINAQVK